jgi:hypothetical protein
VIESFGKDEIRAFVLGAAAPDTKLVTDDWPSYNDIPGIKHKAITVGPRRRTLCCLGPIACSQTSSAGVSASTTGLWPANLQHYLDEFVFRFNRRRTRHAAFDTLMGIGARTAPVRYHVRLPTMC